MSRPTKATVDYFPHDCNASERKTLFILERKYGNDGYAFWFKLLEILGSTENHYFYCGNTANWEFLLAKTRVEANIAQEILDLLAQLEAIDRELWEIGVIFSNNFVERIQDAYRLRKEKLITREQILSFFSRNSKNSEFLQEKHAGNGISNVKNGEREREREREILKGKDEREREILKGKDDIGASPPRIPPRILFDKFIEINEVLPNPRAFTKDRQRKCAVRMKNKDFLVNFENAVRKAQTTPFLCGDNQRGWKADFDWFIANETNVLKVIEGKYDGNGYRNKSPTGVRSVSEEIARKAALIAEERRKRLQAERNQGNDRK